MSTTNSRQGGPTAAIPRARRRAPKLRFECGTCPAYCCSVYGRVEVTPRDLRRIARHFGLSVRAARSRFTRLYGAERILRRSKDPVLGQACAFLDKTTRRCGIYAARPAVCREYPGRPRCAYYDVLEFEREQQEDRDVLPLFQISFRPPSRAT